MPRDPKFDLPTANFSGARICTPFRVPIPERRIQRFKCFRIGRPVLSVPGFMIKNNFIFGFLPPETYSTHFLLPTGNFGPYYRTEQNIGPNWGWYGCSSGRKPVRFGKWARKYPWAPKSVWSTHSSSPQNLRSVGQNLDSRGIYPEMKCQCFVFSIANGEISFLK